MNRLFERLDRLYSIGGGVGANRAAYTDAEDEAHRLVAGWMAEAGLAVDRDPARNLYGRRVGRRAELDEVWTGSHLDSVPDGGRFDGVLGVLAGLEAAERLGQQERTVCVVAFRDEEGWRYGRGCTGSRALTGALEEGELDAADANGVVLRDALGGTPPDGGWLERPRAFVELHVEQGPVLERRDLPAGVVTSVVGLARLALVFSGSPAHAGTTPMEGRSDALVAASTFVLAVRDAAAEFPGAVATVGQLAVDPGAANVIPGRVSVVVDARAPDETTLAALVDTIAGSGRAAGSEIEIWRRTTPVEMDATVSDILREALAERGVDPVYLPSGAGHDAAVLAEAGVPTGLLFVRSRNDGASHSPAEHSELEDVALGVDALAGALARLATAP